MDIVPVFAISYAALDKRTFDKLKSTGGFNSERRHSFGLLVAIDFKYQKGRF